MARKIIKEYKIRVYEGEEDLIEVLDTLNIKSFLIKMIKKGRGIWR